MTEPALPLPRASLECLPPELLMQVLLNLPIDQHLHRAAVSSRVLALYLLSDLSFAARHFKAVLALSSSIHLFKTIESALMTLPVPYLIQIFRHLFVAPQRTYFRNWGDDFYHVHGSFQHRPRLRFGFERSATNRELVRHTATSWLRVSTAHTNWLRVSKTHGNRIAQHLLMRGEMGPSATSHFLDWVCIWERSGDVALQILQHHNSLRTSDMFHTRAVELGWHKVVQVLVNRGLNVSHRRNELLQQAIRNNHCETIAVLLQDPRVDPTDNDYALFKICDHVEALRTLLSDSRVPNGNGLISVMEGNSDVVRNCVSPPTLVPESMSITLCLNLLRCIPHGSIRTLEHILNHVIATLVTSSEDLIHLLIDNDSQNLFEILNLLPTITRFRPLTMENTSRCIDRLETPNSPLVKYLQTTQAVFTDTYLQRVFNTACERRIKFTTELLAVHPSVRVQSFQMEYLSTLFRIDSMLTASGKMTAIFDQSLCKSIHQIHENKNDCSRATMILKDVNGFLSWNQLETLFVESGTGGPQESWMLLLRHMIAKRQQLASESRVKADFTKCIMLLGTVVEFPDDPHRISVHDHVKLSAWIAQRKLKAVQVFLEAAGFYGKSHHVDPPFFI
ncbi:hypothetical protein BJ741DRAFT_601417 [Chytriomyces cf. hyalinus JEL632]|nr:hypothetical protein BJ741DRAFT_601417 [Chytriomyces cf. hyalinus JEL632]